MYSVQFLSIYFLHHEIMLYFSGLTHISTKIYSDVLANKGIADQLQYIRGSKNYSYELY